ncbi:MAG: phage protein D [Lentisphaeria bacterium]|jgi:phage protein D
MTGLATTLPLYSSRPRIKIDGRSDARLDAGLLTLSVKEDECGLYCCEVCFGNWGSANNELNFMYFDRQVFDFGKTIQIEIGDGDAAAPIFTGRITAMEGRFIEQRPPELMILAEDKLQNLRMVRRTRTFEDVSLTDVLETITTDHGVELQVDIDSPYYKILSQLNQSDLAFIREKAGLIDAEVWMEGSKLFVQSRARRKVSTLELTYKQRLHEFSVLADLAHQRSSLSVSGWDVAAKEQLVASSDKSVIESELDGGTAGGQILAEVFGGRHENIAHLAPTTGEEAKVLADAHYRTIARQFVTGSGLAEGDARLKAGAHVTLKGLGQMFNGVYFVNGVHHMFSQDTGYKTHFSVERPAIDTQS